MSRRPGQMGLRIFALAFSILLWIMAPRPDGGSSESINFVERPFVATIEVRGLAEDLEVVEMQEWATLHLRGVGVSPTFDIERVQVYVDLSEKPAGTYRVPVSVIPPFGIQVREIDPEAISVHLEQIITQTLPVRVAALGMPAGARVEVLSTEPAEVQVEGTVGGLSRIAEVIAWVRLPTTDGVHRLEVDLQPVDAQGSEILGVLVRPDQVSVTVRLVPEEVAPEPNQMSGNGLNGA